MELPYTLIKLIVISSWFCLSAAYFLFFMGMHNNTKSGNSFRLLLPWALFDASEFNERGNWFRRASLALWLLSIPYALLCWHYFPLLASTSS